MPSLTSLFRSSKEKESKKKNPTIEEQVNSLGKRFGAVHVTETPIPAPRVHQRYSDSQFPGGFHPAVAATLNSGAHYGVRPNPSLVPADSSAAFPVPAQYPGSLPRPPAMPIPHRENSRSQEISMTLQYAMQGIQAQRYPGLVNTPTTTQPSSYLHAPPLPTRPHSDPEIPRYQDNGLSTPSKTRPPPSTPQRPNVLPSSPATVPSKPAPSTKSDATPIRRRRRNSSTSSLPASLNGKSGAVRCSGVTKTGAQCKNMVKDSAALGTLDPEEQETMKRYCHIHTDQIKKSAGYLGNNVEAPFENFIPDSLESQTQVQLKTAMVEKLTDADREGYIYIYEVQDPNKLHADILEFKVGRSYTPIKRVGQWENSCRSQRHIVRYIFPAPEDQIMLTGMMRQGDPAKFCHRLERLIHLELADLSLNAPYLEMRDKDHVHKLATQPRTRCIDCKKLHQEIFSFRKARSGIHKEKEYQMVKEVVDRWGLFVNEYLSRT